MPTRDFDIVIIGGGAAGIGAARRLADSRRSALLLEADTRLGGRAWTRDAAGVRLDLGAGWLHSADRNSWVAIARKAGIALDQTPPAWGIQYRDLGFSPREQAEARKTYDRWMQRLAKSPPSSDCAADALEDSEWNAYIRSIAHYVSGAELERLSARDYVAYDETSTDSNWRVPGGYGALLAQSLPQEFAVSLATPVSALELGGRHVLLETPRGVIRARAVIVTVSTAVLAGDSIKLPAQLDPWREAARLLPLGEVEKLFLQIVGAAPFEANRQLLGNPRDAGTASYYLRPFDYPVVECFLGGEGARLLQIEGSAAAFARAIEQLVGLFGSDIRSSLEPLVASDWSRTSLIGGAYSYALPGHAGARRALAQSFEDTVFFGGEATSAEDFSTAHGAHDSGVRAAVEALEALARTEPNPP